MSSATSRAFIQRGALTGSLIKAITADGRAAIRVVADMVIKGTAPLQIASRCV